MVLDILVADRVAKGLCAALAGLTMWREQVEDMVNGALAGTEVEDLTPGWSAEGALEQIAFHAAMVMLFIALPPST